MVTKEIEKEPRCVDEIQAEIEETASRIREVNRGIKQLRDERDELLEFRSELQEELLKALGEQLRVAKESES
jgi:uncharacterized coiled-coil DUF342 family protein